MKRILLMMLVLSVASPAYPIQFPNVKKYLIPAAQMAAGAAALSFAGWQTYRQGLLALTEIATYAAPSTNDAIVTVRGNNTGTISISNNKTPSGSSYVQIGNKHIGVQNPSDLKIQGLNITFNSTAKNVEISGNKITPNTRAYNMTFGGNSNGTINGMPFSLVKEPSDQYTICLGDQTEQCSENSPVIIAGHKVIISNGKAIFSPADQTNEQSQSENSNSYISNIISHPLFIAGMGITGFALLKRGIKNLKRAYRS